MARYGLIGQDLGYTQSKTIHSMIGDYEIEHIQEAKPENLARILADEAFNGFSVTLPYKTEVIQYLDELSDTAKKVGAVNTIKRLPDGRLKGYNTDVAGFMYTVHDKVEGQKCVILGSGGSARSCAVGLEALGASEIIIVSRTPEEVDEELKRKYTVCGYNRLHLHYDATILVNSTPAGTLPDVNHSALTDRRMSVRMFSNLELAVDMLYNPYRTKFLQDARRLTKCHTKSGLDMLIVQAIVARNIWSGMSEEIDYADFLPSVSVLVREIKQIILGKQLNVIAIGMPGSGKTTILRRYAYELGKDFIDTDIETEKILGEPIEDVIAEGEAGIERFRAAEHQAVKEACTHTGAVIATGGGTLLNPMNRDILKTNGILVYVKRPLEMLDVKGRPLSKTVGVNDLFVERDRIYRRVCDFSILNSRIFGSGKTSKIDKSQKNSTTEGNENAYLAEDGTIKRTNKRAYNHELKGFVYYLARKLDKYIDELADNQWT